MPTNKHIIGAGLAGLIAASKIKDARIFEAGSMIENHKALLRFRDKSVSEATGVPFEEVLVHKTIYHKDEHHHKCNPAFANAYSMKATGSYRGRSIWNLDPVHRYIAPEDFYQRLVDMHKDRITWNHPINVIQRSDNIQIINTAPLPVIMKACGIEPIEGSFEKAQIRVDRYRLPHGTKIHQTIYFPASDLRVFRASVTGDLLIVESMADANPKRDFSWALAVDEELCKVIRAFGFYPEDLEKIESVDQKYGKIIDLPRETREAILYELTRDFNVFSVGRFATWRNVLLDDVVKDLDVVERLMNASEYGRSLILRK